MMTDIKMFGHNTCWQQFSYKSDCALVGLANNLTAQDGKTDDMMDK